MAGRVIVVGSVNLDFVVAVPRLARPGETVLGGSLEIHPGGKGANQALAAARTGSAVMFVGAVGTDDLARRAVFHLREDGVDLSLLQVVDGPTGCALIATDPEGRNQISVAPGANGKLSPAMLEPLARRIAPDDILLVQLEIPLETAEAALRMADEAGAATVLNPAPAPPGLSGSLIHHARILTPNEIELGALTGLAFVALEELDGQAAAMARLGARETVVTLGERGAALLRDGRLACHVEAPRVAAVDTTAAGDAFNGALSSALAQGHGLEGAIRLAAGYAAASVTRRGAQSSLPWGFGGE